MVPGLRFWLSLIRSFVVTAGGGMVVALTQAMTSGMPLHPYTWYVAIISGLVAAANTGHENWPLPGT